MICVLILFCYSIIRSLRSCFIESINLLRSFDAKYGGKFTSSWDRLCLHWILYIFLCYEYLPCLFFPLPLCYSPTYLFTRFPSSGLLSIPALPFFFSSSSLQCVQHWSDLLFALMYCRWIILETCLLPLLKVALEPVLSVQCLGR